MAEPKHEVALIKIVITKDVYAKLADFKDKWKGEKVSDVIVRVETGNGQAHEQEFSMTEFLEALGFEDANELIKPCETCGGTGEVSTMENAHSGEPQTAAPIGSERCPDCNAPSNDDGE